MKIVTAGADYIDIDAYAGIIAYAELLQKQGHQAQAVCTAPLNSSITPSLRTLKVPLATTYQADPDDTFSLIDISDPRFFERFVDVDRVETVIDHHLGFEDFWHKKIGDGAKLEFLGAACTLVYELWKTAGLLDQMSPVSATLLAAGILDNTLNLLADITTGRDKAAYKELCRLAQLPDGWAAHYFTECQLAITNDLEGTITNDLKIKQMLGHDQEFAIGQAATWDAQPIISKQLGTIAKTLSNQRPQWFMNLISISEGKSYFLAEPIAVRSYLSKLLGLTFEGNLAAADRLWLRKEIYQAAGRKFTSPQE